MMQHREHYLIPDWPAPANVQAFTSTRHGGLSRDAFSSFNMGLYAGDDPVLVQKNRQRLMSDWSLTDTPQWLKQVHGIDVVHSGKGAPEKVADACFSTEIGVASSVLTADCLPVLFCHRGGTVVAAAHAGWKGLCAGVLEATVAAMHVPESEVMAWFGPAIGPNQFEVGAEVRTQFIQAAPEAEAAFKASDSGRWLGDIYLLARQRLQRLGITDIYGGDCCTVDQGDQFFSYRRDGERSGRMATVIWMTS